MASDHVLIYWSCFFPVDAIEKEIAELKDMMEKESDPEKLRGKVDAVQKAAMKIGEAVYRGGGSSQTGSSGTDSADNTKEAEYEEKPKP